MRRPTAIKLVVTVMERPHSIARRLQNLAMQDVKTETQDHIQFAGFDLLNSFGWKSLDKFLPYWFHFHALDSREDVGAVDEIQRIVSGAHAAVEFQIKMVEGSATQLWIANAGSQVRQLRFLHRRSGVRSSFLRVNQQFKLGKVASLNVIDDACKHG